MLVNRGATADDDESKLLYANVVFGWMRMSTVCGQEYKYVRVSLCGLWRVDVENGMRVLMCDVNVLVVDEQKEEEEAEVED